MRYDTEPRRLRPLSGLNAVEHLRDRRLGEVDERDARRARAKQDAVCAWGAQTYYRCRELGIIVRDSPSEGLGGWQYATTGNLDLDWSEIEHVARSLAKTGDAELWTPGGDE